MKRTEIEVVQDGNRLVEVRLGRRRLCVRKVIEAWVVEGRWWGSEERREYVRLLTDGPVLEVYRRDDSGTWHLAKILD